MADYGRWSPNGGDPSLNEINRVDQFIEALSSNRQAYSTDREEAELAFLFADWRDGVRETPTSVTITEEDAAVALRAGQPSTRRVGRGHLAVVGSAAAAVLCLGGFGAAVYGAAPGDGLYGVRTMFFGDQKTTRDDQVVLAAQTELAQVQQLVEQGQWEQAQDKLVALSTTVQSVEQVESKHDLIEQWNALTYKVVEQNPAATLPPVGEPMPVLPDSPLTLLPVPVIADTTSAPTSVPASPSDTSLPSPSDTPGPEVLLTPPSDSSLPATSPSTSPTETSTPPSSTPPSSTPTSSVPTSTTTSPPSTSTTTAPTTTSTTTPPTTTTAPTTTAPTTTTTATKAATSTVTATTTVPTAPVAEAPPPVSQAPAAEPSQPASAPRTAVTTSAAPSTVREESTDAGEKSDAPVTTTVVAPGGGE